MMLHVSPRPASSDAVPHGPAVAGSTLSSVMTSRSAEVGAQPWRSSSARLFRRRHCCARSTMIVRASWLRGVAAVALWLLLADLAIGCSATSPSRRSQAAPEVVSTRPRRSRAMRGRERTDAAGRRDSRALGVRPDGGVVLFGAFRDRLDFGVRTLVAEPDLGPWLGSFFVASFDSQAGTSGALDRASVLGWQALGVHPRRGEVALA